MDIKRTIKEYNEQLHAHKFDNLEEMDQFLEEYNLPKLTQEMRNPNRLISIQEIESIIDNLPNRKHQVPVGSAGESYQTFKEEITPILYYNPFQRTEVEETLPNTFQEARINTQSGQRCYKKRKLQTNSFPEHRCKNPQQTLKDLI